MMISRRLPRGQCPHSLAQSSQRTAGCKRSSISWTVRLKHGSMPHVSSACKARVIAPTPLDAESGRRLEEGEIEGPDVQIVVNIQSRSFFKPGPLPILRDLRESLFREDVWNTLCEKMLGRTTRFFQILVAVPRCEGPHGRPVGVIEVSLACEEAVLRPIMEHYADGRGSSSVTSYAWISSMAVASACRRRGCATAMLSHAEGLARHWMADWLGLRVEGDNAAAQDLYASCDFMPLTTSRKWWLPWSARITTMGKPLP